MTELLQKAFHAASQLPANEQDAFATWMLEELRSEQLWNEVFGHSPDVLEKLADAALAEHEAGKTLPLDPANL